MTIQIRPQDLPELRAELAAFTASPEGTEYWADHQALEYYQSFSRKASYLSEVVAESLSGELFAVTGPMAELAATAGQSLELFETEEADLPCRSGVLVFEQPPQLLRGRDEDGGTVTMHGAAWTFRDDGSGPYAWVTPLAWPNEGSKLLLGGPRVIPFSLRDLPPMTRQRNGFDDLITTLRSAWLLMQQPLANNHTVQPDRAARKRLRRLDREPSPVRVIELRRPKHTSEAGQGDSDREYHHQWIVRGHWRQHWHPKRQVHRPIWIAPHVKGPEGAPLIGGEKVYRLKR
ncbi:hypothetical protein [Streptomyces sp. IBSBF 2950]|uniref:hypothetical protein n=1 Tax=Streptomyces sp. IBSBF 2950 TaxID=2903528 RepID=UPI002FDBBF9F